MKMARRIVIPVFVVLCATGLFLVGMASAGTQEQSPVCRPVLLSVGSHEYRLQACNTAADDWLRPPPAGKQWNIVIDGGMASGSVLFAFKYDPPAVAPHDGHTVK